MRAALIAGVLLAGCSSNDTQDLVVFAAASLTDALEAVADRFEESHPGTQVHISVGPSSLLARQIQHGAPADVFIAANPDWTDLLTDNGLAVSRGDFVLTNRLVAVARSGAKPLSSLEDLVGYGRIAVADPTHVPAGVYARQSLTCAGLWDPLAAQIIPTLDVRAAAVAVTSGAADLAIIYATDVMLTPQLSVLLAWPQTCAPDIAYAASVVSQRPTTETAESFVTFAAGPITDSLWAQFGFSR
ncbi:MAG: molybdate ABC transporter substrate-binding protein [Bacteroidota bacterium]|nr:molybdate ABC transporter substrate-binding protein [Bacteroidota bacterium]